MITEEKSHTANSVLKFITEIDILYQISQKRNLFAFFDRLSNSMLPLESNFDAKFLVMVFKGKIF